MECNKDDAVKATELAEKKCTQRDFTAAKKFCVKALQLYPSLERAKQLLAVVEVHTAAAAAQTGVEDWYGILQVDPFADFPTIRKQYRKMALMLHPDKNRLDGAEPAFKLINEAWMVLSDKEKKTLYDVKRSGRMKRQENGRYTDQPSCSTQSDVHAAAAAASAAAAAPATATATTTTTAPAAPPTQPQPAPPPSANSQPTFWTQCPSCKIQYQYYRKFENYQLLCHRCQTGFVATDIGVPPMESSKWPGQKPKKKATNGASQNGVNGESSAFQQMQQRAREREEKRREEERRRAEREKEREEKRRLKEALKKAKEEERRREALEKQMNKQREREEREARKKNMEAIKKKLKRHRMEEEEDDDDDDDEDEDSDEARIGEESSVPPEILRFGLRRSNRARKNVTYRDDDYDDEDDGPLNKKARIEEFEMAKLSPEEVLLRQELAERGRQHVLAALRATSRIPTGSFNPAERCVEPCVVPENFMPTEKSPEAANNTPVFSGIQQEANPLQTNTSLGGTELDAARKVEDFHNMECEGDAQMKNHHFADQYHYHQQQQKQNQEQQQQQQQDQKEQLQQQQEEVSVRVEPSQDENQTEDDGGDEEESQFLVPDTDFYNFDTDRRESSVREGQVWALYDDTDGMPRFYCEIKQLVSLNPFKVRLRWLERYAGSDEVVEWEAGGFAVTCGQFKCKRRTETEIHFNKFSHLVEVDRIHANVVSVCPRRGEVWAMYKDWRAELRPSDVTYEMVEVIESQLEVAGVKVLLLRKVDGFKTIFARGDEMRTFWCKDLMRFSHKVPAHWMKGTEKENAPQNCWELDTAATPSHLIYRR